jgi:ABC-2 type transport system ATP-binding protein
MHLVRIDNVRKRFARVTAVDGVSFDVRRGEICALLGPNGAGKTTLVRMMIGIFRPDEGTIRFQVDGSDPAASAPPASAASAPPGWIGYMPEERGLYRDIPVHRTLTYFGVLRGMPRERAATAAREWLARMGLADRAGDRLETLSKGNQQKVQIIASLVHRPALAILDEPFSGLDPVNQEAVIELFGSLRAEGMTILLSAHQMDLVERLADRIVLIDHGRVLAGGTVDEVRAAAGAGASARLHEVFLRLVRDAGGVAAVTGGVAPNNAPEERP